MAIPIKELTSEQKRLGRLLMAEGPLTLEYVQSQIERAGRSEQALGRAIASGGHTAERLLLSLILLGYRIPKVKLKKYKIPQKMMQYIPKEFARTNNIVPIGQVGNILCLAVPDIFKIDPELVGDIRIKTGYKLKIFQSNLQDIMEAIDKLYKRVEAAPRPVKREMRPPRKIKQVLKAIAIAKPTASDMQLTDLPYEDTAEFWEKRFTTTGPVKAIKVED